VSLTERDTVAAARAFQNAIREAWEIAGARNAKQIERLTFELEPRMRRLGRPFQTLSDSTIHDNVFGDKSTVSKWIFAVSLLAALGELMSQEGRDPRPLGTVGEWRERHDAARRGQVVLVTAGPGAGLVDQEYFGLPEDAGWWWSDYHSVIPQWARRYLTLEPRAHRIMAYQPRFIPDLLQTPDYARAALLMRHPDADPRAIEAHLKMRMLRQQQTLGRAAIWALLEQAALQRQVGSPQIMRDQYRRLAELYSRDYSQTKINMQVVSQPEEGISHAGPYVILRFESPDMPDVAYLPYLDGPPELRHGFYLDDAADLASLIARFSGLGRQALSRDDSRDLITNLIQP
jgi:hypothetical protein